MNLTEQITQALVSKLSYKGSLILRNVYVHPSPWECDVLHVTKTLCWTEYEIKVSVEDFKADFRKCVNSWSSKKAGLDSRLRKHVVYREGRHHAWPNTPVPKRFFFVTPKGLISPSDVPDPCGLLEVEIEKNGYARWKVTKNPKQIKHHLPITHGQLFELAKKATYKTHMHKASVLDTEREWQIDL